MTNRIEKIAVFCGSSVGTQAIYQEAAISLAQSFYEHNIQLIYGGAKVGLMGIIADHLLSLGGYVIGIMPQSLIDVEIGHEGLSELYVVDSLYERKKLFEELADGFVLMPGGPG